MVNIYKNTYTLILALTQSYTAGPECQRNSTEWSPCSATCDVGISRRKVVNKDCEEKDEIKLCYLRPCGKSVYSNVRIYMHGY